MAEKYRGELKRLWLVYDKYLASRIMQIKYLALGQNPPIELDEKVQRVRRELRNLTRTDR